MRALTSILIGGLALTGASGATQAATYSYTDIIYPGALTTAVTALNASGVVAGTYYSSDFSTLHGMIYDHGVYTTIDPPGSLGTTPTGIADDGTIVGYYDVSRYRADAFVYHNGVYTTFGRNDYNTEFTAVSPSGVAYGTQIMHGAMSLQLFSYSNGKVAARPEPWSAGGIFGTNNAGAAVGRYVQSSPYHPGGLVVNNGSINALKGKEAANVTFLAVNDSGVAVGDRLATSISFQGVIASKGSSQTVNYPGAADTILVGIDAAGDMAGLYDFQEDGVWFSFILKDGAFTTVAPPGAIETTIIAMNPSGQIVGNYSLGNSNPCFIGTPQ